MTDLPHDVKRLLTESKHPLGVKELLRLTQLHPGQQTQLKRALRDMVRSGELLKEGKRFRLRGASHVEGAPPPPPAAPREDSPAPRDPRFAPRGRFARDERTSSASPRGRFSREGRPEPRGASPRVRPGGGAPARPGPSSAPASRGRFSRDERRFEPRGRPHPRQERFEPRERRGQDEGPRNPVTVDGVLHVHRDGYGFVHPLSGQGDNIFLPPQEASRALDNDRVRVEAWGRPGRMEGRLVGVLDRTRQLAVGTYVLRGRHDAFVEPHDKNLQTQGTIRVPPTQMARDGDVVKVRLGIGADLLAPGEGLHGEVAGSLGKPGDPSAEVLSIAYAQGFNDEFPPEVMDEADSVPTTVSAQEAQGEERRDLRSLALVTIDGEDARDFDDAVWAEDLSEGWRLVVAIADVTHYVRERSALDAEALRRATSVYLPDRVLPMLPERLSNGICSLRPDEDRLCMVADMVIDRKGLLVSSELYPAVMRSQARCTYNEVQDVLEGKDVPHRNAFKPHFERLLTLSRVLTQMRKERGAIDFNLPEHKVVMGEDGVPARMEKRERKDSHRLIEECMLAANEAVAKFFSDQELPSVYRYHGSPDEEKLALFAQTAQTYGFYLNPEDITPKALNAFMAQLQGHPEERALNQLLLRSMMQAIYTAAETGHYGLAAEYYLHFTSPIRRYPDLLVHRLLKAHWARQGERRSPEQLEREEQRLEDMAAQSSERERAAMQAEREVVSFYAALMMKDRVGEEFAATVTGAVEFGFFVDLDEVHVEGLVRADTLGAGARFDKAQHSLTLPGGLRVRVGQKVRVRLASVNLSLRRIDFEALELDGKPLRDLESVARQERDERRRLSKEERKQAARTARERFRQERWGKPQREPEPVERSLAEAEEAQRLAAEASQVEEAPIAPPEPVAPVPPPEPVAPVLPPAPRPPSGFERIRALASLGEPPALEEAAPAPAKAPTRRGKTATAKTPARAKRAAASPAREKAAEARAEPAGSKQKAVKAGPKKADAKRAAAKKASAKEAPAKEAPAKKARVKTATKKAGPQKKTATKKTATKKAVRAPTARKAAPAKKGAATAAKRAATPKTRAPTSGARAGGTQARGAAKKTSAPRGKKR